QVEKGESSPTINTLWKIATGLQVPYTQLIDIQATKPFFVPKAESALVDDGKGYRVYHYNRAEGSRDFEFFNSELDTGASFTSEGHGTHTRESLLVTAGELVLVLEKVEYVMAEGDFIQFDSSRPHTYINRGEVMTVFTNIVYYEG
ncbi:helix-turn-helix domain-containing protein, partial [Anaerotignum lactatifermentans]